MKNLPARERPGRRNRSAYSRVGKHPYHYPKWVVERATPPYEILKTLAYPYHNSLATPTGVGDGG